MTTGYHRKKQPELVRQQSLDVTAQVLADKGTAHLTLDLVAREAGVTKGGLLHHFPNKNALLEALCDELLRQMNDHIAEVMANDPEPTGRFSRAYLDVFSRKASEAGGTNTLYAALFAEANMRDRWRDWLEQRYRQHEDTDSALLAVIVRLAADGLWFVELIDGPKQLQDRRQELLAELNAMTRRK
jgi:AcrR family transcriptional regulator